MQRIPTIRTRLTRVFKGTKHHKPRISGSATGNGADTALDVAQLALKVTSAFVDGVNVPFLKGAVDTASMIVGLVQVSVLYEQIVLETRS